MVENDTKLHKPQIEWPLHSPELNKQRPKYKTAKAKRKLRTVITKCLVKVFLYYTEVGSTGHSTRNSF